jgi:aspartate-semialdehyde dehydrogenase
VSVKLGKAADLEDVKRAFAEWNNPLVDLGLPSAPDPFIVVVEESNQPQPVKLVEQRGGMPVWIGRIRECEVLDFKFVLLVHNTVRGAAGGAILNAELLVRQGLLGE